ncbi:MAG: chemotaxis protein CheW [Acidobacteria bacterium]|nr:chemotaxis protein CheW [Acidobacteriota bacterium]
MNQNINLDFDDELLAEFVNEAREHLATIEVDLLAMEARGAEIDIELVNKVFRAAHSIKGASSFFGLNNVKELAHKAETVLDMIRSRKMAPNAEVTNLLLGAFDQLRVMINRPAESVHVDIDELVQNLTGLASSYLPQDRKASISEKITLCSEGSPIGIAVSRFAYEQATERNQSVYLVEHDLIHDVERQGRTIAELFRTFLDVGEVLECEVAFEAVGTLDDPIINRLPLRVALASSREPEALEILQLNKANKVALLSAPEARSESAPANDILISTKAQSAADTSAPLSSPSPEDANALIPVSQAASATVEDSVRVNVSTLDTLMNLTGELVLGKNQLRTSIAQNDTQALNAANQRINQIASELQDVVMQTRLQAIGNVFGKLPRLVRDLAASLKKEVQLEIHGRDVALDRTLLESLSDPLTHMVRNAVDHGIESPADRVAAGKRMEGRLKIEARHEAGQVVVEIEDDGRGIDPDVLGKAALSKGLLTAEKLESMSSKDKMALIFLPGFSTSSEVSEVSGRGVGMDVVKTNLDHLGGKIEIISVAGRGTTFRIKLPLTLAIIPCLIVSVDEEQFAVPQINVEEMRHVVPGDSKARVEKLGEVEVLVLRDRLIPLVRLEQLLRDSAVSGLFSSFSSSPESPNSHRHANERELEIVVVTTGTQSYGLVVSRFQHTEEIVVKPLGSHLKGLEEYAGATILGDGSIALIVDIAGIAGKANIGSAAAMPSVESGQDDTVGRARSEDLHSLVLFGNGPGTLCAVHSDTVRRIERVDSCKIEMIGGRRTMQYNGGLLPVVTLADTARVEAIPEGSDLAVIIAVIGGREIGLLGTMPVDVVEAEARIDHSTHRQPGVAGSTIVREKTVLVVDLHELIDDAWPDWTAKDGKISRHSPDDAVTVLLAEDSDFFRAQIKRFLTEDGYRVLDAQDGEAAWELLLSDPEEVDAVVTDVEMPRLDGLGLVRRIRADERTLKLPVIALTSLAGDEDVARGKAAGVNEYQTKLDREQLLGCLRQYTSRAIGKEQELSSEPMMA